MRVIDVSRLPLLQLMETEQGGLNYGSLARNADTAYDPAIQTRYPLLASAILAGASPQLRNMAIHRGNLLQRTVAFVSTTPRLATNERPVPPLCSVTQSNRGTGRTATLLVTTL